MTCPPSPWRLHGSMWVTAWRTEGRTWGTAFVDYTDPSPLVYRELLVARLLSGPRPRRAASVEITDIWVDSPASRDGGRALWAIPKQLAELDRGEHRPAGRLVSTTSWSGPGVGAGFDDVSRVAPRTPYAAMAVQPAIDDHRGPVRTPFGGTARTLPCRATWRLDADGPLAFLRGARQLGSVRMTDFAITFGT